MIPLSLRGIFIAPDINWSSLCCNSHYSTSLCNFVFDYYPSQVIQIPTHTGGNILDALTNTPEAVFNVNVALSPLHSDQFAVTFHLSYVPVTSSSSARSHLIILKLIGLDYLSTFSIMTLIYCFMIMMILFGSLSRTFSCPPFICTCGSDSFCCQLHTLV